MLAFGILLACVQLSLTQPKHVWWLPQQIYVTFTQLSNFATYHVYRSATHSGEHVGDVYSNSDGDGSEYGGVDGGGEEQYTSV